MHACMHTLGTGERPEAQMSCCHIFRSWFRLSMSWALMPVGAGPFSILLQLALRESVETLCGF